MTRAGAQPRRTFARTAAIGLAGGLLSGLLGVGGGIVIVPMLVFWLGLAQRDAHATSLAAIIPIAAVGVTGYALVGEVRYGVAAALAAGSIFGARFGSGALTRLSDRWLKGIFGVLVLAVAASMALR